MLKEKNNRLDKDADATDNEVKEQVIPNWQEGQHITLSGCTITEGKTKPKPLHTESTLLAAMETAGKEIEDDTMRQAMKDSGIGTPATRAAIIETLLKREYMVRQQKKLVPTEKGLALHSVVKNMAIANVEMTGKSFSAAIAFDENFNTKFVFAEHKTAEKRGNVKRYKK